MVGQVRIFTIYSFNIFEQNTDNFMYFFIFLSFVFLFNSFVLFVVVVDFQIPLVFHPTKPTSLLLTKRMRLLLVPCPLLLNGTIQGEVFQM